MACVRDCIHAQLPKGRRQATHAILLRLARQGAAAQSVPTAGQPCPGCMALLVSDTSLTTSWPAAAAAAVALIQQTPHNHNQIRDTPNTCTGASAPTGAFSASSGATPGRPGPRQERTPNNALNALHHSSRLQAPAHWVVPAKSLLKALCQHHHVPVVLVPVQQGCRMRQHVSHPHPTPQQTPSGRETVKHCPGQPAHRQQGRAALQNAASLATVPSQMPVDIRRCNTAPKHCYHQPLPAVQTQAVKVWGGPDS